MTFKWLSPHWIEVVRGRKEVTSDVLTIFMSSFVAQFNSIGTANVCSKPKARTYCSKPLMGCLTYWGRLDIKHSFVNGVSHSTHTWQTRCTWTSPSMHDNDPRPLLSLPLQWKEHPNIRRVQSGRGAVGGGVLKIADGRVASSVWLL